MTANKSSKASKDTRRSDVEERVVAQVAQTLKLPQASVPIEAHFYDDLGGDSLARIDVIAALEDHYDVLLPEADVADALTLSSLADLLAAKMNSVGEDGQANSDE